MLQPLLQLRHARSVILRIIKNHINFRLLQRIALAMQMRPNTIADQQRSAAAASLHIPPVQAYSSCSHAVRSLAHLRSILKALLNPPHAFVLQCSLSHNRH